MLTRLGVPKLWGNDPERFWEFARAFMVGFLGRVAPSYAYGVERIPTDHDDMAGFREEIRHFLTCVRTGQRPRMPGEEARAALELVLAAYRSAEREEKVALPLGVG